MPAARAFVGSSRLTTEEGLPYCNAPIACGQAAARNLHHRCCEAGIAGGRRCTSVGNRIQAGLHALQPPTPIPTLTRVVVMMLSRFCMDSTLISLTMTSKMQMPWMLE